MRALIQRVSQASCVVDGEVTGSCGTGFLVLLGIGPEDSEDTCAKLWGKIARLRVFDDAAGKMNLALADVDGGVLVVSQFTLYADARHGNRPGFTGAAKPAQAIPLYERFCALAEETLGEERVGRGIFGADMKVSLTNDGPVTLWLDSDELFG